MANGVPNYLPGFEPDDIKKLLSSFFAEIDKSFPDKVIIWSEWNHERMDKAAGYLCKYLGYSRGKDFLEAYGYAILQEEEKSSSNSHLVKNQDLKKEVRTAESLKPNNDATKKGKNSNIGCLTVIIIVFILWILVSSAGGVKTTESKLTCPMCGKTYRAGDIGGNYLNIAKTHMCKSCEQNYLFAKNALEFYEDNH